MVEKSPTIPNKLLRIVEKPIKFKTNIITYVEVALYFLFSCCFNT